MLVAFDLFHPMKTQGPSCRLLLSLKLDMAKAYDGVEWGFLEAMLQRLGFAERWVSLVMHCGTSISYSILVNGKPIGPVMPTRGLWQGDIIAVFVPIMYRRPH